MIIADVTSLPIVIDTKNMFDWISTRKYLLRRYILGMLMHITAWDQHWGDNETLKRVLIYVAWLCLA